MTSLKSQSTLGCSAGSIAKALVCTKLTPGNRATEGASGALSTLLTFAPSLASTQVQPPGLAPRSMHVSPGPGWRCVSVNSSHSLRYARLGGLRVSSTKSTCPCGNGLEHRALASKTLESINVKLPRDSRGGRLPKVNGSDTGDASCEWMRAPRR